MRGNAALLCFSVSWVAQAAEVAEAARSALREPEPNRPERARPCLAYPCRLVLSGRRLEPGYLPSLRELQPAHRLHPAA